MTASTDSPAPRIRLTARGRRALAVLVATPVLALGALAGSSVVSGAIASEDAATASFEYVTVMPGQTLWQIAESVAPSADPREVVAEIELLNGLSGALQAGDRIAIPATYTS